MPSSVVRNWFDEKLFGFIIPDQGDTDVFVHRRGLENARKLTTGDAVTFKYAYNNVKSS